MIQPDHPLHDVAPAKLNLGLHVCRRRADGYHDLETVFLRIPWADVLTATPADALTLTCTDPSLPTDRRNLCLQAAHRLAERYGVTAGAALHLEKRLPYGAGLGGGSSDAATTLRLLCRLWQLDLPDDHLRTLGAEVGSDVPFFITDAAAAYAEGRGERLLRLPETGAAYTFPFALVVVVPPVVIATAEAYRHVRPNDRGRPDLRALVAANDLAAWRRALVNDFEAWALEAYPAVAEVRRALVEAGAGYAALSGSGAAVFGVFEQQAPATAAAEALRQSLPHHHVWHGVL